MKKEKGDKRDREQLEKPANINTKHEKSQKLNHWMTVYFCRIHYEVHYCNLPLEEEFFSTSKDNKILRIQNNLLLKVK